MLRISLSELKSNVGAYLSNFKPTCEFLLCNLPDPEVKAVNKDHGKKIICKLGLPPLIHYL